MGRRRKHRRLAEDAAGIEDAAMPMYLQEAASVLEAKLAEFTTSSTEPSDSLKRILDRAAELFPVSKNDDAATLETVGGSVCRHKCRHHKELMDPALWGTLPNKLLFRIFARLPMAKIMSLKSLSHQWRSEFGEPGEGAESGFLQVCDANPAFGLLTRDEEDRFWVRLLDVKLETWHAFQIKAGHAHAVDITAASADGGLVCFISSLKKSKTKTFLVDVVNPLTQHVSALPLLHDFNVVLMVQMIANPKTKLYKVLVVGEGTTGRTVAKLYDPSISLEKWTGPKKQKLFVHGYGFHWGNFRYNQKRDKPYVYDFSKKKMLVLKGGSSPLESPSVKSFALFGDRVFVLKKDRDGPGSHLDFHYHRPSMYYIVEFRLEYGTVWCKMRNHDCSLFTDPPKAKYDMSLFACKDFLMVLARLPEDDPYRNEVGWFYNLSTCRWSCLPNLPGQKPYHVDDLMCRLQWNASV